MEFTYTGIDKNSTRQKGKIQANSDHEVIDFLRTQNITPISVRNNKTSDGFWIFKKVKNTDIVLFTRQLSSMSMTGLTLIESLKILKQQKMSVTMEEIINDLIAQVSEGTPFSDALASHGEYFSEIYVALIRAAEKGGLMDKVLGRLADNLEKSDDLKKKIKSALFYPMIVVAGMGLVLVIMNVFVIPQLGTLYQSLNVPLPLSTRIILGMSTVFVNYWPLMIIAGVGIVILYNRFKKSDEGIKIIDSVKLKIPVFGQIITLSTLDEISRTLSLLISSGASIIESLNITANVAGNYWYKEAMLSTSTLVEKGVSLSDAFQHQNLFPPMLTQMVKVGESTGQIDQTLIKISEYFERDLDLRVKNLTTAIEPILIVGLGIAVGVLILSIITPIYSLISQIQ